MSLFDTFTLLASLSIIDFIFPSLLFLLSFFYLNYYNTKYHKADKKHTTIHAT